MSTIKELIDLTIELSNRTQNRQFAAEISRIQTLTSTLQAEHMVVSSENLDLKAKIFEINQAHAKEVSALTEENTKLKKEKAELIKVIADLKNKNVSGSGFSSGIVIS